MVEQHGGGETGCRGIERRLPHAMVGCQTDHIDSLHAPLREPATE
ncbi:MAG: hypothetical protein OXB92_12240 [Acidimicrobiaceae bacterium]|nr:hypothetical protein [Acidimicrobiaceae bacterium]